MKEDKIVKSKIVTDFDLNDIATLKRLLQEAEARQRQEEIKRIWNTPATQLSDEGGYKSDLYKLYLSLHDRFHGE